MKRFIRRFILTLILFVAIDAIWIMYIAQPYMHEHLANLLTDKVKWPYAIMFWCIYVYGLMYFCINRNRRVVQVGLDAAFFGFIAYMTYAFTNKAILSNWPTKLVVLDVVWGPIVSGVTAMLSKKMIR